MATSWQTENPDLRSRSLHLFTTKTMSDCSFLVGKEEQVVVGHKLIISVASSVLANKIEKAGEGTVVIADVQPDVFEVMLKYIYTYEVTIENADMAYRLCNAARIYELLHLERECYKFIADDLNPKNALYAFELAKCHNDETLKAKCEEVFKTKTDEVIASESFKTACLDSVVALFSLEPLEVKNEVVLLKALDGYAKEYKKNKPEDCDTTLTIGDALQKIRFLSLSAEEFVEGRSGITVLEAHDACAVLANIVSTKSDLPMPTNFSKNRQPRKKRIQPISKVELKYKINDFKNKYESGKDLSSHFMMHDVKWKTLMEFKKSLKVVSLYVYCNYEDTNDWTCNATVDFKILREDKDPYEMSFLKKFETKHNNWGYTEFCKWDEMIKPENKYLKDDILTLTVTVQAEELKK